MAILNTLFANQGVSSSGGTITGDLTISGDLSVSGSSAITTNEVIQGTSIIDVTNTEAFLVRKDSDGGDVFLVDTTNAEVEIGGSRMTGEGANKRLKLHGSGDNYVMLGSYDDNGWGYLNSYNNANGMQFYTGAGSFYFSNGNVGIGTSSPDSILEIEKSVAGSSTLLELTNPDTTNDTSQTAEILFTMVKPSDVGTRRDAVKLIAGKDSTMDSAALADSYFAINTLLNNSSTERMRIDSAGDVGIGTAAPGTVNSTALTNGGNLHVQASSGTAQLIADGPLRGTLVLNDQGASSDSRVYQIWSDGGELVFTAMNDNESVKSTHLVLDANSRISLSNNDAGADNTVFGFLAGASLVSGGDDNTLIGDYAGNAIAGGDNNTVVGSGAGLLISTGIGNTTIGNTSGNALTDGNYNVFVGHDSGGSPDSCDYVVAIGQSTLGDGNATQDGTVAIGREALKKLTTGTGNVAVGYQSLDAATDSDYNTAVGYGALSGVNASGTQGNTAMGYNAGLAITSGLYNTLVGRASGLALIGGSDNTFMGNYAGGNTTGVNKSVVIGVIAANASMTSDADGTVAIGYSALTALTSGERNLAVGYKAMLENAIGNENIAIGYGAMDDTLASLQNDGNIAIGTDSMGGTWVGNACTNNLAIGTDTMLGAMDGAHNNTGVGTNTLLSLTTGDSNVALGKDAGDSITTANNCTLIGQDAGQSITVTNSGTSDGTVAIGSSALAALTSGASNVAVGYQSLSTINDNDDNVSIGYQSSKYMWGSGNIAIGKDALLGATFNDATCDYDSTGGTKDEITHDANADIIAGLGVSGTGIPDGSYIDTIDSATQFTINADTDGGDLENQTVSFYSRTAGSLAIGDGAAENIITGTNTCIGSHAGNQITTGSNNTIVGHQAGNYSVFLSTGNNNVLLGDYSHPSVVAGVNQIVMGFATTGVGDNYATIGNASTTRVYAAQDTGATFYGAGQSWSDKRMKENVKDIGLGLDFVNKLEPIQYTQKQPADYEQELKEKLPWYGKSDPRVITDSRKSRIRPGLLAQDVLDVLEELGFSSNTSIVQIDEKTTQHSMDYSGLVVPLIKAVQELSAEVESLKEQLNK